MNTVKSSLSVGVFLLLALVACERHPKIDSPEAVLNRYVSTAFQARSLSDKKDLMSFSVGPALEQLKSMNDEEFRKNFIDSGLSLVSLKTKDLRQESDGDVSLVYELDYKDHRDGKNTVNSMRKIAFLTHDKGEWKIKSTRGIKTFVERKEDLVITPEPQNK